MVLRGSALVACMAPVAASASGADDPRTLVVNACSARWARGSPPEMWRAERSGGSTRRRTTAKGSDASRSTARVPVTIIPARRANSVSAASSRDLPVPAAPPTKTTEPAKSTKLPTARSTGARGPENRVDGMVELTHLEG